MNDSWRNDVSSDWSTRGSCKSSTDVQTERSVHTYLSRDVSTEHEAWNNSQEERSASAYRKDGKKVIRTCEDKQRASVTRKAHVAVYETLSTWDKDFSQRRQRAKTYSQPEESVIKRSRKRQRHIVEIEHRDEELERRRAQDLRDAHSSSLNGTMWQRRVKKPKNTVNSR